MGVGQARARIIEQLRYGLAIHPGLSRKSALAQAAFAQASVEAGSELFGPKALVHNMRHEFTIITIDEKS